MRRPKLLFYRHINIQRLAGLRVTHSIEIPQKLNRITRFIALPAPI
jgi:hypothetical protein